MEDFKVLKFLDIFKGLFNSMGVDYNIMRRILQVKLTMDGRRVPTIISNSRKRAQEVEDKGQNSFLRSLWIYALIGLTLIPFIVMGKNYLFQMSIAFGVIMFLVMSTLISDFSAVLLDIRDKDIISTKPINSRTISMAKTIHVLIYMFFVTIAVTGIPLIISMPVQGILFFIVFLCEIILVDLFIVVLTALLYMLILRFFDGEKLKDIINYVQIGLSIVITIGYQLIGRLFNIINLNVQFTPKWWQYFIVPVWFAGPFELLLHGNYDVNFIAFSVLAVLGPIAAIILYIRLIPSFERNLQKLSNNTSRAEKKKISLSQALSRIICFSKDERLFFRFTSDMMKNEREFKLRVYPTLGMAIIFPFIFLMNELQGSSLSSIAAGRSYLFIYFCAMMLPLAVMMIKYSARYKAAWIYRVIPVKNTADIFRGTLKAFAVKLLAPVYLVESVIFTVIFGIRIIPDLITVFLTMMLFVIICFRILKPEYPFSQAFQGAQKGQGLIVLPAMLLLGVFAGVHAFVTSIHFGSFVYLGVMLIVNFIVWRFALKVKMMDVAEDDRWGNMVQ